MKKQLHDISSFHNENVEKMLAEESADIINDAVNLGKNLAERQLPQATGVKLISIIGGIKARFEALAVKVCKELQSAIHFPEVNTDRLNVEEEKKKGKDKIGELSYKINELESEQKKLNVGSIYRNVREMRIKTAVFFAAEAFFTSLSFQFFGESLLSSLLIAIPFTAAVSEYAHLVALQYKKYKNPLKRKIFLFLSTLFAAIVFLALSYFRSQALGREGYSIGTLFFVIINIFIYLVAAFLHYKYSPTKEEKLKYHGHKRLQEQKDGIKAEIGHIESHHCELDSKLNEKAILALAVDHYAKNTLEEIRKIYEHAVAEMKNINIMLRTDKVIPECFSEPTPPLDINYDFNFYKSIKQE
jgi:hypothetical protein